MFQQVNIKQFCGQLSRERSTWTDIKHYPSTITLRRMIRLADFVAEDPKRWKTIRLHFERPELSQEDLAKVLRISQAKVSLYLQDINLATPDDYPDEL